MKCLYITDTRHVTTPYQDGSTRYRCYNIAEELCRRGYTAHIAPLSSVNSGLICQYDVVVFLRPAMSRTLCDLVNLCIQKNIVTVADYDDLLFRPELANTSPSVLTGRNSIAQMQKIYSRHRDALLMFKQVTVATAPLLEQAKKVAPTARIHHLPNALSSWWLSRNLQLDILQPRHPHLLYLPGSRSHDHDFETINHELGPLLAEQNRPKLKIIGPLRILPETLNTGAVVQGPEWVKFDHLPRHIVQALACLAPLANSEFNRCKSHIKFLEAAAFGTPLFATAIPDIQQHEVEGLFFPNSTSQWQQHITMLADPDYHRHCAKELRRYVQDSCRCDTHIPNLLNFYLGTTVDPDSLICTAPQNSRISRNSHSVAYSPAQVTLADNSNKTARRWSSLKRKYVKFKQSPRHFIADSKVYSFVRDKRIRSSK